MKRKISYSLLFTIFWMVGCNTPQQKEEATAEEVETNVVGHEVSYSADSTTMNGYIAFDENDTTKRPGILVVHEWWGHNKHARDRADMLGGLGYVALAVDMYGDGQQAAHPRAAGKFAGMVMGHIDVAKARFESGMERLQAHPYVDEKKMGAIGFCFGGSIVLMMANAGYDLDAVVAFHAGLRLPIMPDSGAVKAKVLVVNGAADPMVSSQHVSDFKTVMEAAGADYKYVSYEGVKHAYTNKEADSIAIQFKNEGLAYHADADSASWEEMKRLFASVF